MSKNIFAVISAILVSLISLTASARPAEFVMRPSPANGVVHVTEGDALEVRIAMDVSCDDFDPGLFGISPDPQGQLGSCEKHPDDPSISRIAYAWNAPQGEQEYAVQYGPWNHSYKVVGSTRVNPDELVTREEYDPHVDEFEEHKANSGEWREGTIQVLAEVGGMPNDDYFQRPAFLVRGLVNVALVRSGSHGFVLGVLGGYGRTNFNVSPAFASLTEEAPVDIGEFALMPQYSLRPESLGWLQWNIGVPMGLRYYSYEAQVMSLNDSNADALANNDRQFAFWLGVHTDLQFIIAKSFSVGPWAQFSLNPTRVDTVVGDDMDSDELMPQFSGGAILGADF